jgi:hypothetical protein
MLDEVVHGGLHVLAKANGKIWRVVGARLP